MLQNNVKMNMDAFKKLQQLDDLSRGVNVSGTFALLVINMNGNNVTRISFDRLVTATKKKAQLQGVSFQPGIDIRSSVRKTLTLLAKDSIIKSVNLPLSKGQLSFKISSKVVRI